LKVISFKVEDEIYKAFKNKYKDQSFRSIYKPLTIQLLKNNGKETKYTPGIRKNSDDLYNYLCLVKEDIEKIIKNLEVD
jgi:hypothetical protein